MKSLELMFYKLLVGFLWSASLLVQLVVGAFIVVTNGWPVYFRQKQPARSLKFTTIPGLPGLGNF